MCLGVKLYEQDWRKNGRQDRHTVLGSFWHESINTSIVSDSVSYPIHSKFFFLSFSFFFFFFFSLMIIVGGDVSHSGMIVLHW